LATFADILPQSVETGSFAAVARKGRAAIDRAAGQVLVTPLADGAIAFEDQAEGVELLVAAGAGGVGAVAGEGFAERQVAEL